MCQIRQNTEAYSGDYKYMMDIEIIMDYYPKRIIELFLKGGGVMVIYPRNLCWSLV